MQRRDFIGLCLVAPTMLSPARSAFSQTQQSNLDVAYIAAAKSRLGEHYLQCFNSQNKLIANHQIPSRGHGFAVNKKGHIAAIARRPADFCVVLDHQGNKITEFYAQHGRHFYGHGVFDVIGDYLFLTENDYQNASGVLGVYDVQNNYARVDEIKSHGIGPHMIQLDKTGKQLIVANGGIETHPYTGRKKLNLETMQPSLVTIDIESGDLVRRVLPKSKYHQNSIRHFAVASDNTIYLGLQNEGDDETALLLARLDSTGAQIEPLKIPQALKNRLNNYVGDICLDQSEQTLIASSPHGNSLVLLDTATGESSSYTMNDVCAVCATKQPYEFIVSAGTGVVSLVDLSEGVAAPTIHTLADVSANLSLDNHLLCV